MRHFLLLPTAILGLPLGVIAPAPRGLLVRRTDSALGLPSRLL